MSLFWQLQLAGWVTYAVLSFPMKLLGFGSPGSALAVTACQLPIGLALSTGLRRFYLWARPADRPLARAFAMVLLACAVAGTLDTLGSLPLNRLLGVPDRSALVDSALYFVRAAVYLIWSLGYFAIKAQLSARAQSLHAAVAGEKHRLELLRYQLNPRFLAQSLKAIGQEIDQNPAAANAMTRCLAEFYQGMLRQNRAETPATIGDEIALVRTYLELERLRQRDALRVVYVIDESLLNLPLPPIVLLPLVEKAVRQRRGSAQEPLTLTITVQPRGDGQILIEVANSRRQHGTHQPFPEAAPVENIDIRTSLDRHYPGRHRFTQTQDSLSERATLCLSVAD
ncbi:MAG: histidine kinase [Lacunisphaera sp.]|nr:histidine kinase [Lacunisphaera sp.]